jgi:2-succinyl-6-hydroxy-2,4-cyclohexadiene-1-carboxylate synthase
MSASPIVFLHGFSGHADSWSTLRGLLPDVGVHAVTAFGHDPEHRPSSEISFDDEVERIVARIRAIGARVRLCGYSMGGRLALGVLGKIPETIEEAFFIGAHPGLTSDEDRRAREASDAVWVGVLENEGIEAFAEKWQAQALFASQSRLPRETLAAQHAIRLRHDARSLGLAMTSLGLGRMPSYWDVVARGAVPMTLVVGGEDAKFKALARRLEAACTSGRARVVEVDGAGHNVVLERPDEIARLLR